MCLISPAAELGPSNGIRLRTIHHQFYARHSCCQALNLLPVPQGEPPAHPMVPLVQAFTKSFVTPPWQSGTASHRGTPQVHCHSQKQILPEGFHFLLSLFAEFFCRSAYPGTFEGKAVCCRPTAREPVTSSCICSNAHITENNLAFKVLG